MGVFSLVSRNVRSPRKQRPSLLTTAAEAFIRLSIERKSSGQDHEIWAYRRPNDVSKEWQLPNQSPHACAIRIRRHFPQGTMTPRSIRCEQAGGGRMWVLRCGCAPHGRPELKKRCDSARVVRHPSPNGTGSDEWTTAPMSIDSSAASSRSRARDRPGGFGSPRPRANAGASVRLCRAGVCLHGCGRARTRPHATRQLQPDRPATLCRRHTRASRGAPACRRPSRTRD